MLLHIKVKPGSRLDEIIIGEDNSILVKIMAPPVDGQANEYLVRYLAEMLDLPRTSIVVKKGITTPFKTLEIDASEEYVQRMLGKIGAV